MNTFKLKISSPDGDAFAGDACILSLRGSEGDLAVMANHAPFITSVVPCTVRFETEDGVERFGKTDGGILSVRENSVTLLSASFVMDQEL